MKDIPRPYGHPSKDTMIEWRDITDFFDYEAKSSREKWDSLMELPLKERIRKRKAIENVFIDFDSQDISPEGEVLIKLNVKINLSDFKEGERMLLHKDGQKNGINCTLNKFEEDGSIIVSIFPLDWSVSYRDLYGNVPLILDKDYVDLRQNVFDKFTSQLLRDSWEPLVNGDFDIELEDIDACKADLDESIESLELTLTNSQYQAVLNSMATKSHYLIQGPPGTGKSFVLGLIILEELAYFKHKVVVIGPNHMAINNTLEQVLKMAPTYAAPIIIKVGQYYNAPTLKVTVDNTEIEIDNIPRINVNKFHSLEQPILLGMTPHCLYTSRAGGLECDTLVIDEAGQMTIPLALMGMIKAKKIILAGDHKQLPPIITSDKIIKELKVSIFQRLITERNCTMLDISFRMCKPICNFVSSLFYEGKLKAKKRGKGNLIKCNNQLYSFETPIVLHEVDDDGEQTSEKEADFIVDVISEYLMKGLSANEIAVITPFRAQAALVRRLIQKCDKIEDEAKSRITADTVDKMQGQEREVIIYSMTTGDSTYMTEMADFLYNPNKLNVAFSRAKSKLIIVGNFPMIKNLSKLEYKHIHDMLSSEYITIV